jgi:hypothetical protein
MKTVHIKPELASPFPNTPEVWKDPITGLSVPKRLRPNIEWRIAMQKRAEGDTGLQKDLLAACAVSQLFWFNAFMSTWHQFDVGPDGSRIESKYPNQPMITWEIQDRLLRTFEECVELGEDVLIDKARDMGASWCCLGFIHWNLLFNADVDALEVSRNEEYVDKTGNMKALFQRHDFINTNLPEWMRPPDCFVGQKNRQHMHWYNPLMNTTLDGESTTKVVAVGDRRKLMLIDEFGLHQHGKSVRTKSRDAALVRIINSTSQPGSEYNKWRRDKTIKVFVMPYWEHPDKGRGRYVKQEKDERYKVRSPWYDKEEAVRGAAYMATEVDREDLEPGISFFKPESIELHKAMFGRKPSFVYDVQFRNDLGYDEVRQAIKEKDLGAVRAVPNTRGPLRLWCPLIDGRPDQTKHYLFGIDVSKGMGASNSVVAIKCIETGEKIGEWASALYPSYEFAPIIVALALWVGGAVAGKKAIGGLPYLRWEDNGPGWDLGRILVKKYFYPNYATHETTGKVVTRKQSGYGYHASTRAKFELMSAYASALDRGEFVNRSVEALDEALDYVNLPNGGVGPSGFIQESSTARATHGDRVIADALAVDDCCLPHTVEKQKPQIPANSAGYRFTQAIKAMRKRAEAARGRREFNFAGH